MFATVKIGTETHIFENNEMYMLPKAFLRSCTYTYTKIKLKFTITHRQNHIHTQKRETHKNTRHYIQTKAVSN